MRCRFSFKHMKTSEALIDYAESKITQKVEKYSTKPIEAHVTFSVDGLDQKAHCLVTGGDGFNFQVDTSCADMYGSVDMLLDKLETQLKRQKEKLKQHKRLKTLKQLELVDYVAKDDCDSIPIDADDLIKYERARAKVS